MRDSSWRTQLSRRFTSVADIPAGFHLSESERNFFAAPVARQVLSFSVTPYYLSLADPLDPNCPIRRQVVPTDLEFVHRPYESSDPLYESAYTVLPGLIHHYPDRCALKVTDRCAVHCRFCFRRYFTGKKMDVLDEKQIIQAAAYLEDHDEVTELLLTGGDPLVLEDDTLNTLLGLIRAKNPRLVLRIGTRTPAVLPRRITPALVKLLGRYKPLWIITHFNHPKEMTAAACQALALLLDSGIPVLNQTVLLKGINDHERILAGLFTALVGQRVKPYYLFQGDLVKGTAHFRTGLSQGVRIMQTLCGMVSGICRPMYAVDLPRGGGKVTLTESNLKRLEKGFYIIENYAKKRYKYPREDQKPEK